MQITPEMSKKRNPSLAEQLEDENRQMELRLHQLKISMERKKANRQSTGNKKGVIWKSSVSSSSLRGTKKSNALNPSPSRSTSTKPVTLRPHPPPESPNTTTPSVMNNNSTCTQGQGRKMRNTKHQQQQQQPHPVLEALPHPPEEEDVAANEYYGHTTTSTTITTDDDGGEYTGYDKAALSESFDEVGSHNSFLEALEEWRRGSCSIKSQPSMDTSSNLQHHHQQQQQRQSYASTSSASCGTDTADSTINSQPQQGMDRSLLEGEYDEAANAAAFQAAVMAWRNGTTVAEEESKIRQKPTTATTATSPAKKMWNVPQEASMVSQTSEGCQTIGDDRPKTAPIEVEFKTKSSLSYMERLLLKRRRENADLSRRPMTANTNTDQSECTEHHYASQQEQQQGINENASAAVKVQVSETMTPSEGKKAMICDGGVEVTTVCSVEEPSSSQDEAKDGGSQTTTAHSYSGAGSPKLSESRGPTKIQKSSSQMSLELPFSPNREVVTPSIMDDFEEMERRSNGDVNE